MYKDARKTKEICCYMETLALHNGAPTVNFEDNTSFISVVESKRVNTKVKTH